MKYLSRWAGWAQCETRGYFHTPKIVLFFPSFTSHCFPSGKPVRVAVGRSLGSSWVPPQLSLQLLWGWQPGVPTQSPFPCHSMCPRAGCALWGRKMCLAPGSLDRRYLQPLVLGRYRNPYDMWRHFKSPAPGIMGMWAHSSSLFFLPPLFNFKLFPTLTEASSKI